MRVALVAVKQVPVGGAALRVAAGLITRDGVSHGIDPLNEVALEWALRQRDTGAVDRVMAVSIGDESAADTLRQAMAMGADEAILVAIDGEPEMRVTARLLASVTTRYDAELVILGYESLDGSSGTVPAAVAATLNRPLLSRMRDGALTTDGLTASRDIGDGAQQVSAPMPAVVSVVEGAVTPRFPKLKQLVAARSASITHLTAAELGVASPARVVRTLSVETVPPVTTRARVVDLDAGVEELFAALSGTTA